MSESKSSNTIKSIFPHKLWRLVNDSKVDSAIKWAEDGLSFFIYESPLKKMCLGKENNVFFTRQPKSFIRQLHLYGFRKINKNQFTHQFFQRGRPDLLKQIKRFYKPPLATSDLVNTTDQLQASVAPIKAEGFTNHVEYNLNLNDDLTSIEFDSDDKSIPTCKSSTENPKKENFVQPKSDFSNLTFPTRNIGALVLANNYDGSFGGVSDSIDWIESSLADISYAYNEDSILTLCNNDIYPNTCECLYD